MGSGESTPVKTTENTGTNNNNINNNLVIHEDTQDYYYFTEVLLIIIAILKAVELIYLIYTNHVRRMKKKYGAGALVPV